MATLTALQSALPDLLTGLVGLASVVVMLLILGALVGFVYKSMTGGIEWPEEDPDEEETLQRGDSDDEWDYY